MLAVAIRHQRRYRAKGFNGVNLWRFIRLRAVQQGRREERAISIKICLSAEQRFTAGGNQFIDVILHILTLFAINGAPS